MRTKAAVGVIGSTGVIAVIAAAGWLLVSGGNPPPQAQPRPPKTAPAHPAVARTAAPPASATIATVLRNTTGYASPGDAAHSTTVLDSWYGRPSVLPVIATKPGWVQVRLAQRPNGSTAWVRSSTVRLGSTSYRIVVHTDTLRLDLFRHGKLVFSAPAGLGSTDDPTPAGQYFVAFDEPPPQPNSGYGSFIMVTSAHSPVISDWEGSGDAIIGIHGPLGMDSAIGTTGARVSHGCIRLHDQALKQLADVPPGTPIDVVS